MKNDYTERERDLIYQGMSMAMVMASNEQNHGNLIQDPQAIAARCYHWFLTMPVPPPDIYKSMQSCRQRIELAVEADKENFN